MRYAAVEGGGTSWVVAIAVDDPTNVVERADFPTTTPAETIGKCVAWLSARQYDALGVATFGPVDLAPHSPTYGYITTTPKPGWKNVDVLGPLRAVRPAAPVAFDTPPRPRYEVSGVKRAADREAYQRTQFLQLSRPRLF